MPYRCQKCMNTFKTLSLYNRHAVDCKHIKGETKTTSATTIGSSTGRSSQVRTVQSFGGSGSAVVKRNFSDSGIGQSSYSPQPQNKRINAKIEFKAYKGNNGNIYSNDDEITIIDNNSTVKQEVKTSASTIVEIKKPYSVMNNVGGLQSMNQGPRLFRCFECDKAFDTKSNLEVHVREGHKDKFCDECEDDFSWPDEGHDCYYTRYQLRYISGDIVPTF